MSDVKTKFSAFMREIEDEARFKTQLVDHSRRCGACKHWTPWNMPVTDGPGVCLAQSDPDVQTERLKDGTLRVFSTVNARPRVVSSEHDGTCQKFEDATDD